jgi:hypothetical protein
MPPALAKPKNRVAALGSRVSGLKNKRKKWPGLHPHAQKAHGSSSSSRPAPPAVTSRTATAAATVTVRHPDGSPYVQMLLVARTKS